LEENNIAVHLSSPTEDLFRSVLALASKPFIVSGDYAVAPDMVEPINAKGVVLAITVDPAQIETAVSEISGMRTLLGDTDNLVLSLTTTELADEAKTALYMGLRENGWAHTDIAGQRRAGGGITGGNLSVFSPARAVRFRR
jgi:hypothetical protein